MKGRQGRRGFTLIEVMVAIVMFAIGTLGMGVLTASIIQANRGDTNRTRAIASLRQKVEGFQSRKYTEVTSGSDEDTLGGVVIERTWTVTENDPAPGLRRVSLVATWTDADGEHRVRNETIKATDGAGGGT